MKIDYKGKKNSTSSIQTLMDLLNISNDLQLWKYMGMRVEIDPTIDYTNENVLVRWLDIKEGFNDKIIVNSLKEFNTYFKPVHL